MKKIIYFFPEMSQSRKNLSSLLSASSVEWKDLILPLLKGNSLRVKQHTSSNPRQQIFNLKFFSDSEAIKYPYFPRGFFLLFEDGELKSTGSFYPKFHNDDVSLSFTNVSKLVFNKKYSGYLIIVAVEKVENDDYVLHFSSKGDINNSYTSWAEKILLPYFTTETKKEMFENELSLSFEVMSLNDMTHGSKIINEMAVCTCIAKRSKSPDCIAHFFSLSDARDWCLTRGIPISEYYTVEGKENCEKVMNAFLSTRDQMTNELFDELISSLPDVVVHPGNTTHDYIYGNGPLEGLVMRVFSEEGKIEVLKYKFINYVIRTMGLREAMKKESSSKALEKFNIYSLLNRWCSLEGMPRWISYWENCIRTCNSLRKKWEESEKREAFHIFLADSQEDSSNISFSIVRPRVFAVVGPVGVGKSTFANALCEELQKRGIPSIHIDADLLGSTMNNVLSLKNERNNVTLYQICREIGNGILPIISCGGGQLSELYSFVMKAYEGKVCPELCLFVPSYDVKVMETTQIKKEIYLDSEQILRVIRERGWDEKIDYVEKSLRNYEIVMRLSVGAKMYSYPCGWEKNVPDFSELIVEKNPFVYPPSFLQHRIFTRIGTKNGHITISYGRSEKKEINMGERILSSQPVYVIRDREKEAGKFIYLIDEKLLEVCPFAHVTLSSSTSPVICMYATMALREGKDCFCFEGTNYLIEKEVYSFNVEMLFEYCMH